ncbi:MAG: S-layer protein domain-containing protein [Methanosarcinaceae archaeon]
MRGYKRIGLIGLLILGLLCGGAMGAPDIDGSTPSDTDVSTNVGEEQMFIIHVNETCNITWYINGSQMQFVTDKTDDTYTNDSVQAGIYNVTAFVKNINGTDQNKWIWNVSVPLSITGSNPTDDPETTVDETQKFNITTNQNCTIIWKINSSTVQTNTDVNHSLYENSSALTGSHNVTAIALNANGTPQKEWTWTVSNSIVYLSITDSNPTDDPETTVGEAQKFNITTNKNCTITWKINGSTIQTNQDVKYSSYENSSALVGSHNVTAIASNENGILQKEWTWDVQSKNYYTGDRIWDELSNQSLIYTWDANSYSGFYYDLDSGLGSEKMIIELKSDSTTIENGKLTYSTTPINTSFEHDEWGKYQIIGFMAERYFAGYHSGTFGSSDDVSLISNGHMSKVLINEDEKRSVYAGSALILEEGYTLNLVELDLDGNSVYVELTKDGSNVDDMVLSSGKNYVYEKDLGSTEDVPIIAVHFDTMFQGPEHSAVFVKGIFQISDEYITVEDGDTYGEMEVVSTSGKIVMKNDDTITLSRDKTISIMGDIKFKVADDSDTVRYYPFIEVTTASNDALNISMADNIKQGDSVTITVTSRGAVISGAAVKFDDEDIGSTSNEGTITHKPDQSGKFTVTAEKEGYVSATGKIEVISLTDETKKMSIEISPDVVYEGTRITISTIKSIGGEAIEDVDVSYDGNSLGTTASDGTISYTVKESGMHKLIATNTDFLDAELNLEVLALKAKFEFSNLVVSPLEVKAGKDVTITLNASNTGKAGGDYNVDLMINGNLTESKKITLAVNESTTIEFTVAEDEPGTYRVEVNGLSGTFEVLKKAGIIFYILGLIGAFVAAAVAYMFTAGGWTVQMVSEKLSGFIGSVR